MKGEFNLVLLSTRVAPQVTFQEGEKAGSGELVVLFALVIHLLKISPFCFYICTRHTQKQNVRLKYLPFSWQKGKTPWRQVQQMIVRGHAVGLLLAVVARCLAPGVSPFGYASAANKDVNSGSGRHEVGDSEKICEMAAELVNTMRKAGALGKEVARHVEEASAAKERSRSLRLRSEAAVQDANDAAESTSVYGISGSAGGEKAKRVFLRVDAAFEGFRKAARTVSALVSLVLERAATAELKINETEKLAQTEVNNTLSLLDAAAKEVHLLIHAMSRPTAPKRCGGVLVLGGQLELQREDGKMAR
ncbi:unnamed protein product [Trypanosoma congolense IL3000]|uniref:WGS project CAEQ00000000 data, annotated contig 1596 n=1 Tax=Trypanosoma congolense (strain IL3000) TaxID=1068625 RepID=F9W7E8_TRYCI|nr:unnamed protein product [Trypanosoma congolense IL3000]